ncbi:hypothetical protein HDU87_002593 [Geranomyces variabilis]|uniref:Mitochondrial carrier n=1 Tax=Geranomyces variabilis TaxID=109894 RepID=A0AAD5TRF1_9FUNG|nr:hypothetical protein HDU87_002593 [Geranomyces variabilis]
MSSPPSPSRADPLRPPVLTDSLLNFNHFAQTHAVTIAATSAAVTSVICGYPFDSIKTRMQAFRYESSMACIRSTFHAEGLAGFYRGVLPIAASISVLRSISFSLYNGGKTEVRALLPADMPPLTALLVSSAVSGAFAGSVVATLNAPIDFIKLQKQLERIVVNTGARGGGAAASAAASAVVAADAVVVAAGVPTAAAGLGEGAAGAAAAAAAASETAASVDARRAPSHGSGRSQYPNTSSTRQPVPLSASPAVVAVTTQPTTKSTTEWARHIVNMKGPSGLYSGYSIHLVRDAIGTAFYFSGYEFCKHVLTKYLGTGADGQPGAVTYMLAGGIAGTLSWLVLFPIDITKSVLQREALQHRPKYLTALQFITTRWRKSGIRGFYNGIGPQLVRSFPVHSINFLVYENVVRWCRARGAEEGPISDAAKQA